MKTIQAPVTGRECQSGIETSELTALSAFYKAFNERNMELMHDVWLNAETASMDNPLGGIKRGWAEIQSVYERIFNGKAEVYVEFYDYTLHSTADMFFVTGRERGYFKTGSISLELAIRTTRVFIKSNNEWKLIHHHGSITDPGLLRSYQESVAEEPQCDLLKFN